MLIAYGTATLAGMPASRGPVTFVEIEPKHGYLPLLFVPLTPAPRPVSIPSHRVQREELRDFHSRHVRFDWAPQAAVFRRGLGLHVVRVHVPRPAVEPKQNDRRVFARLARRGRGLFGAQDLRQANRAHPCHTQFQKAAAALAITVLLTLRTGINGEHGGRPGSFGG